MSSNSSSISSESLSAKLDEEWHKNINHATPEQLTNVLVQAASSVERLRPTTAPAGRRRA